LSDPTNTVRLYQLMRDATDATFEIERDGAPVSISVSLSTIQ
jgi:type II secretory pathway component PulC